MSLACASSIINEDSIEGEDEVACVTLENEVLQKDGLLILLGFLAAYP